MYNAVHLVLSSASSIDRNLDGAPAKNVPSAHVQEHKADKLNDVVSNAPAPDHIYKTGMAGAPTAKTLLIAEMKRRHERGALLPSLSAEATELLVWLTANHPDAPQPKKASAENALRTEYWKLINP